MSVAPGVASQLNQLLQGLISSDNEVRSAAEKLMDSEWRDGKNVGILLTFLAENSVSGDDETIKSFSAVLFRRIAIRSPKDFSSISERTIGVLDEATKQQIRLTLLQGFASNQSNQVRRKLADAISEVAKEDASPRGTWPELVPAIFQLATSPDESFRESAYRILSTSPEIIDKEYVNQTLPIFSTGFEDESDEVRIATCTAYVSFFRELPKSIWQHFTPLLPNLLNSLPRFLQNGQDQALANVLESLIDLVEIVPKMFKEMLPTIIDFCSSVAKNVELDGGARLAALELLTTFSEVSPAMCKQSNTYTSVMVSVNLSLLTEVSPDDEDAAEWNNESNTEDDDDEPEYDAARQSLDRIALKLGGQSLAAPLFHYLPTMCQSSHWREVFAALMALSSAAEGCVDVLITEIPRLLDMILPTLNHPHSRVQYACCNALGQISTDFADVIQRTAGDRILPALISKLTNKSVPRVQAHAAAALVNFSEAASKEVLEPYLDDLLSNLLGLLQSPKRYVQEQVLITIAIIADAAEQKFIKYHDTLLPMLIGFLKTDMGPENRMLTAKCIECATLISMAVGKDNFATYGQELIQILGGIQESIVEPDDPVKSYLEQGWGRICRIIGNEFLPYLPIVLPPLLASAKAAQDISLLEEDEAEDYNNNDEWDVINLSGKLIAVHTAALDDKVSAMDLLRVYATQLKGLFFPWVKEIAQQIAIPALDFYLHDGVRASAALTLAALLKSTVFATSPTSAETLEIWSQICSKLAEVATNEPVPELLVAYYTALIECIGVLGVNLISSHQLQALSGAINTNLSEIFGRINAREGSDDEYTEAVDDNEEEYTDEELLDEINKAVSIIFKVSKVQFLTPFQSQLLPLAHAFISDENTNVRLCGLCMICDVFEHCGSAFPQTEYLAYIVSDCLTAPQASIRQAAAFAIGVAAQNGGETYAQICSTTLPTLFEIATFPDARADENLTATENCVASIAKICRANGASIPNLSEILHQWITLLPIIQDTDAATTSYEFLLDLIQSNHAAVSEQKPKVIDAVLQALSHKSIDGQLASRAVNLTSSLLSTLPHEQAVSLLQNFSDYSVVKKWFT
ncbi:CIC11C00000004113 [Sungouiella intermedia]|uniref:CIC11C00000004113 n=1 Tax=Sungouiella intermedia TaxID=45354 RepID=A0A1L0DBV1_9ASCO|nr:CIC11C00000004113 [[Candida] intermedia]